ncbi:hypothetical protein CK203_036424 [Vitis vinifera]|uniref:Uncharacterized protein n=1 Tax=Vitis vinifera TaxID=29760 RepID=A0A438HYP1_VITVI|nr:hypothetical protein CK203_036424 [Vitis vinifera]
MEALSQLLSCARNGSFIYGFRVGGRGRKGLIVSHPLFADDTLIFCDADADQLQYLSWTFMWFEAISSLKVNLSKTEAIPMGEGIPMETLASVLGCKIGSLPTSYLGLPLRAPYKATRVWETVEERFRKRLSLWKRQYLSKGGHLTLLKSTLSSLPTYFLSLFVIPKRVICAAKKDGGLGICSLATFNKALLGKWLWRFANENESLWKQIISTKYDLQEGGWCSKGARDRHGVGVWKAIRNEGWVAEAWEENEVGGSWGLCFTRHLNDWEVGEVESLLSKLHPLTIRRGVNDSLRWKEYKNGTFLSRLTIVLSQGPSSPSSWLELFGRLGFQFGLASLDGRQPGTSSSPLTA